MRKILLFITILIIFCVTNIVQAQEEAVNGLIVSPGLIDEKARAKEIFDYDVKLKNVTDRKIDIYAVVDDISDNGQLIEYNGPGSTDRTVSLSNWILFKRGVIELNPGEETTVPLKIQVGDYAVPGKRYAQIVFAYGSNRAGARESAKTKNFAKIMLNVDVTEDIVEKAQIQSFQALKKIFLEPVGGFKLELNNFGNKNITPRGDIFIYDRRNREIISINANPDNVSIVSGESANLSPAWTENLKFGKYKAKLELEYGEKDMRDLQDTVFFWVMPLKILLIIGISLFIILVLVTFIIFRRTFGHHNVMPIVEEQGGEESSHVIDLKNQ